MLVTDQALSEILKIKVLLGHEREAVNKMGCKKDLATCFLLEELFVWSQL